jgi:AbrB family looped-hinge helix DNA binding protein
MTSTTLTSKGQVTIPKSVRQQLGLRQGSRVAFVVEGDHAVMRPALPARAAPASGFGMVKVKGPAVAPDFDVASLLAPAAQRVQRGAKRGAAR